MSFDEESVLITKIEQRCRSNTYRIEALERSSETLCRMAASMEVLAAKQQHAAEAVDGLTKKVERLESRPGERWNGVVDKLLAAAAGALAAAVIGALF